MTPRRLTGACERQLSHHFEALRSSRSPVHNATELIALLEGAERRGVIADARGGFTVMNATRVVLKRGPSDTNPNEQVCWALGRLDESPQWKDVDASNIEAREDGARVASGPIAARDASRKEREREQEDVRSALAELQEDARAFEARPNAGDYWYVLLQHAFLGAAQGDAAVAKAAAELLSTRGTRPMVEAAKKAARILAGLERATSPTAPPLGVRQMELPDLIPHVASAFVDERPDLVRDALREFRTTTAARPRRIAIMRCMQILTGEKRSVYLGEREAQGSG